MAQFEQQTPPDALKIPVVLETNGHKRIDPYYWMNQRDKQEVLDYITSENNYSENFFNAEKATVNQLLDEFEQRIDPNDQSAPFRMNGMDLQFNNCQGKDYRELWILQNGVKKTLFFDENERAKNKTYYALGDFENSPNNKTLAFSEDAVGRRKYTIRFRDNVSGKLLKDEITNTDGSVVWANDNKTVYYVRKDETTLREFQVYRHVLGTSSKSDELVFQENDERFYVYLQKTFDDSYIVINAVSTTTSECILLDANNATARPHVFLNRIADHLYQIDHHRSGCYILSNYESPNRKLAFSTEIPTHILNCEVVIPHSDAYLDEFLAYDKFLVIQQRLKGQTSFLVGELKGQKMKRIDMMETVFEIALRSNDDYFAKDFHYTYTSFTTPPAIYSYHVENSESHLIFQKTLRDANFSPNNYISERVWITANDGSKVPVSLVYKKGIDLKKAPLLLYGYGSYGVTIPCNFSPTRLSLLDRGFIFAVAHIRGGKFLGEHWYQDGKLNKKRHSFTDFINAAEWLAMLGYGDPSKYFAQGGSAGGLLMGAVANMAPNRFKGIIAQVPFVDVVTTMLDDSLPLTVGEYEEWGNPNEAESYWYMLSYSPYDNVQRMNYPAMLITTGYHDSQVQYWEPLKWVAKLRDLNTSKAPILFDCTMSAGHGGGSGRTNERLEVAKEFAFLLHLAND